MAVPVSATSGLGSADILWKVAIEISRMMRYSNTKVDDDDSSSHLRGEVCLFACGKGARVETSWASIMNVSATVRSFVSSSPHDYAVWVYLAKDSTRNTSSLGCMSVPPRNRMTRPRTSSRRMRKNFLPRALVKEARRELIKSCKNASRKPSVLVSLSIEDEKGLGREAGQNKLARLK